MARVSFHDIVDIAPSDYLQPFLCMLPQKPQRFSPEFTRLLRARVANLTSQDDAYFTVRRESYGAQRTPEPPRVLMDVWLK